MTACRWVASDRPRVLSGHHEPDCPARRGWDVYKRKKAGLA